MSDVKQYNCRIPADSLLGANLYQQVVLASDYDALAQRCRELEKVNDDAIGRNAFLEARNDDLRAEVEALHAELEITRGALAYVIDEADGWHDDARGGPIESEEMDRARSLLDAAMEAAKCPADTAGDTPAA